MNNLISKTGKSTEAYIYDLEQKIIMLEQECSAMREQLKYMESQVYGGVTK